MSDGENATYVLMLCGESCSYHIHVHAYKQVWSVTGGQVLYSVAIVDGNTMVGRMPLSYIYIVYQQFFCTKILQIKLLQKVVINTTKFSKVFIRKSFQLYSTCTSTVFQF